MPATTQSHIRANVHFKQPTVYAGEDLECIIEFRNTARPAGAERAEVLNGAPSKDGTALATHSRKSSFAPRIVSRSPSTAASTQGGLRGTGHRPTLSLNVVSGSSRGGNTVTHSQSNSVSHPGILGPSSARPANGHSHGRSLSIISLGSEAISEGRAPMLAAMPGTRPGKAHMRSASLQHPPKLSGSSHAAPGPGAPSTRQPSPLYEITTPPALPELPSREIPARPARRRPGTVSAGSTPQLGRQPSIHVRNPSRSDSNMSSFKFPAERDTTTAEADARPKLARTPSTMHSGQRRSHSPRPLENWSSTSGTMNPLSRIITESSNGGTPRTSSEFYSTSNHSAETLMSEVPQQQQQSGRLLSNFPHSRQVSRAMQDGPAEPETLMMAYAQTMGHFTLDGSLVNAAPFEEVKRKGVQGRGGVVGVERPKRASGLFGALGWGNIGESLGGLLGGDEMSSMAQMKASAGSRTIPLLSTPQTLLFVDLRLAPGESQSYTYRFSLPRGLPPSHKGRAIKVTYHLTLGIQRPEGQVVKRVDVPFRVLGSYDSRGDALGHDLMSPYVLLQDAARTSMVKAELKAHDTSGRPSAKEAARQRTPKEGLEDFLRYTERLREAPVDVHGALLSPTSPSGLASFALSRERSFSEQPPANAREAIDFAILRSNFANTSGDSEPSDAHSSNRFNITRSGQPVAVLTLLRPAYRLGEAVIGTLNFTAPGVSPNALIQASNYSVVVELESSEHVDPSLALRSNNSIHRVTRKVHALQKENSLFARQISFNLAIPSYASPSFETTGVSLVWRLKIEFTTQRLVTGQKPDLNGAAAELMDEISRDERGITSIAKERLAADTFEIAVPIKVFGAFGVESLYTDSGELVV